MKAQREMGGTGIELNISATGLLLLMLIFWTNHKCIEAILDINREKGGLEMYARKTKCVFLPCHLNVDRTIAWVQRKYGMHSRYWDDGDKSELHLGTT